MSEELHILSSKELVYLAELARVMGVRDAEIEYRAELRDRLESAMLPSGVIELPTNKYERPGRRVTLVAPTHVPVRALAKLRRAGLDSTEKVHKAIADNKIWTVRMVGKTIYKEIIQCYTKDADL